MYKRALVKQRGLVHPPRNAAIMPWRKEPTRKAAAAGWPGSAPPPDVLCAPPPPAAHARLQNRPAAWQLACWPPLPAWAACQPQALRLRFWGACQAGRWPWRALPPWAGWHWPAAAPQPVLPWQAWQQAWQQAWPQALLAWSCLGLLPPCYLPLYVGERGRVSLGKGRRDASCGRCH